MLSYTPGDSLAHRLDPRTKLLAQAAFAAAAFVYTTPRGLAAFTLVTAVFLVAGRLSPVRAIRGYLPALPFLAAGPVVSVVEIRVWAGRLLGIGVALVFRFLPLLRGDLRRVREASATRLGGERGLRDRMEVVASAGIRRAFGRADRLALALRARCFAWNPTLPELRFGRADAVGLGVAVGLVGVAVVGVIAA